MNRVLLQVVVSSLKEEDVKTVQDELKELVPELSFSPAREQASLENCLEFMATGDVTKEQKQLLIDKLDNDWDISEDGDFYSAYAFNTKMFSPLVYYLQMEF